MTEKQYRYLALAVGMLVAIAVLYLNSYSFTGSGLFANKISSTMVFQAFKDGAESLGATYRKAKDIAYYCWFLCLGFGGYLSWLSRIKLASVLSTALKTVHEKT